MFPAAEITQIGGTFAFVITESGKPEIYRISPIMGRIWSEDKYGIFNLNKTYRYISLTGKSEMYFYDQRSCNPLNISSLVKIDAVLDERKKKKEGSAAPVSMPAAATADAAVYDDNFTLTFEDLIQLVDKLARMAEEVKQEEDDPAKPFNSDVALAKAKEILKDKSKRQQLKNEFGEKTIRWLNDFYLEDDVAYNALIGRVIKNSKYKPKNSMQIMPWLPQGAMVHRNMAIVIIDDRTFDIVDVSVEDDFANGIQKIDAGEYGIFKFADTKTRYRYGGTQGTNIFILAVNKVKNENVQAKATRKIPLMRKQKEYEFKALTDETISIHATTMLPRVTFTDPAALKNGLEAIRMDKTGLDDVTADPKVAKKWDLKMIIILAVFGSVALAIIYSGVIEPILEGERAFQLELEKWRQSGGQGPPPQRPQNQGNGIGDLAGGIEDLLPFS